MQTPPSPLFLDPIYEGPTDPTIVRNPLEGSWWIIYTQRRANVPCHGYTWVHGTDLGVASSQDNGRTWLYRGTLNLEPAAPGRNTFWAPEVLWEGDTCHMFVSHVAGVPAAWVGDRKILHYTSRNMWDWAFRGEAALSSGRVIDACVHPLPGGAGWRMWYKDEADDSRTHYADSPDLFRWTPAGRAAGDQAQEGPNVFALGDRYWLIADVWDGLGVYSSADLTHWLRQPGNLLDGPGIRPDDESRGHHADVLTLGERAYIFYHVLPEERQPAGDAFFGYPGCRSALQVALLTVEDGRLTATRDEPFDFTLPDA